MMYEEYTQKVLKLARIKNKLRKFRALIILSVLIVVGLTSTLLGITGIMTEESSCPSVITYGQDLGFDVSAVISDVFYQYRESGKTEWVDGQPRAAGTYDVRAVTTNSFGGYKYSDVHTVTIKAKDIEVYVLQPTIAYGDEPMLGGSTMYKDRIVCNNFIYGDETKSETTICPDINSITIVDENNVDVSSSYSISVRETDVNLTKRSITLTVPTKTSIYNGQPFVFKDTPIVTSGSLAKGDEIKAVFDASQTEIGSTNNAPEVRIYSRNNKDVSGQYDITENYGDLVVEKRPLIVNTHSLEVIYDGTPHSNIKVDADTQTPLVDGHRIVVTSYASLTSVGEIDNVLDIVILDENDNNVTDNYIKSFAVDAKGSKIVVKPRTIMIETQSKSFVYDGEDHFASDSFITDFVGYDGLAPNEEIVPYGVVTTVKNYNNGQEVQNVLRVNIFHGLEDVTDNYNIEYKYGKLVVLQRPFKLSTKSETRVYSGTAWSNNKWEATGLSLVSGHSLIVSKYPSIINVGQVENVFEDYIIEATIDGKKVDVTNNYDIEATWGILEVTKKDITIQGNSKTKVYDGTALSDSGVTITGLLSMHTVKATAQGTITEAGTVKNVIKGTIEIVETKSGNSVISNYNITKLDGDLTINPRQIKVESLDTSKIYDGTKIVADYSINPNMSGLTKAVADGQAAHVEINDVTNVSESGTTGTFDINNFYIIDSSANKVTSKQSESVDGSGNKVVDFKNYIVTFVETGILTIYPRKISVQTKEYNWIYDGNEHSYAYPSQSDAITFELLSNNATGDAVVSGHVITVVMSATVKNVSDGSVDNTYSSLVIKDKDENIMYDSDDSLLIANYQIDSADVTIGKLSISPISIAVDANSKTKVYDGQTLKFTDYTLTYADTDGNNIVITYVDNNGVVSGSANSALPTVQNSQFAIINDEFFTFDSTEIGPNVTEETKNVITFTLTKGEETNYAFGDGESEIGMLEITPIELVITTRNATKVYDGTSLIASYDVEGELANGQVIELTTIDSIKNVSQTVDYNNEITSFNIFTSSEKTQSALIQNTSETIVNGKTIDYGNYIIVFSFGKLEITPIVITYTTGSSNKVYDGQTLTSKEGTFKYAIGETQYSKTETDFPLTIITDEVITYVSTEIGPDVTAETNNDFTFMLNGDTISSNYAFEIDLDNEEKPKYGILEITAREITITTGDAEKTYDGLEYAGEYLIDSVAIPDNKSYMLTAGTLAGDQVLDIKTHQMKNVSDSGNNIVVSITIKEDDVNVLSEADLLDEDGIVDFGNYKITFVFGTITVNEFVINYTLEGHQFVYNGQNVKWEEATFTYKDSSDKDVILTYEYKESILTLTASGDGVAPVVANNTFAIFENEALSFVAKEFDPNVNGDGEDNEITPIVSEGYDINNYEFVCTATGKIKINPILVTITTNNDTKEYDGDVLVGTFTDTVDSSTPWISGRTFDITLTQTETKDVQSGVENKVLGFDITYIVGEQKVSDIIRPENETFEGVQDYGNYIVTFVNSGELSITQLVVKYTTASGEKTYDGEKFSKPEGTFKYTPNGGTETEIEVSNQSFELVAGEVITFTSTEIGPLATPYINNEFTFALNGEDTYSNYSFVTDGDLGQIRIVPRQISLLSKGAIWAYDGSTHSYVFAENEDAVSVKGEIKLADGDYIFSVVMNTTIKDANANSEGAVFNKVENIFNPADVVIKHKGEKEDIDVTSSYAISIYQENSVNVYGELIVKQLLIEYSTPSATKVYDGTKLSNKEAVFTDIELVNNSFELVPGEVITYTSTEIGPNVTSDTDNEFSFMLNDEAISSNSSNYELKVVEKGKLSITPNYITITTGSASKEYDGTVYSGNYYNNGKLIPNNGCGLVTEGLMPEDHTLVLTLKPVSASASDTPYSSEVATIDILNGESESALTKIAGITGRNNDYGNFMISFEEGTIEIRPIVISYRIFSVEKTYDGTALTNPDKFIGTATIAGNKVEWKNSTTCTLITREELAITTTKETACGAYDNIVVSYTVNGGSTLNPNEGNYRFVEDDVNKERKSQSENGCGLLKISKIGFVFKIETNSFNLGTYDTYPHVSPYQNEFVEGSGSNWGYKVTGFYSGLDGTDQYIDAETEGYTYEVTMNTPYTNAGVYNNHPTVVIKDDDGNVVTDEFTFEYTYGLLTIEKVVVNYTLDSVIYLYDGDYHSNADTFSGIYKGVKYTGASFTILPGEEINIVTTSKYERGEYNNIVTSYTVNTKASENYEFVPSIASKLTIRDPEQLIVHTDSETWSFDGQEHENHSAKVIGNVDSDHSIQYNWALDSKILNVGVIPNVALITILNSKGQDVTNLYSIDYTSECGTLTVTPMIIVYTSNDTRREYNGEPLFNTSYSFSVVEQPDLELVLDADKNIKISDTETITITNWTKLTQSGVEEKNLIKGFMLNGVDVNALVIEDENFVATGSTTCNYSFVYGGGTLYLDEIARVEITTRTQSWLYDGNEHRTSTDPYVDDETEWGYKVTSCTYKDGENWIETIYYLDVEFTKSVTDVSSDITYNEILVRVFEDAEKTIEITEGVKVIVTQGIISIEALGTITIETIGYDDTYDGNSHGVYGETIVLESASYSDDNITIELDNDAKSYLEEGYVFSFVWNNVSVTNVFNGLEEEFPVNSGNISIKDDEEVEWAKGFNIVTKFGKLIVRPIEITYSTESASKTWDGKPLYTTAITLSDGTDAYKYIVTPSGEYTITKNAVSVDNVSFVNGEEFSFDIPSVIDVTSGTPAEIKEVRANLVVSQNYKLTATSVGTLTVYPRGELHIVTNSFEKMYDGEPLISNTSKYVDDEIEWGYKIDETKTSESLLASDVNIRVDFTKSQTSIGSCNNEVNVMVSFGGEDVTEGITVIVETGKLTVIPFVIYYSSGSKEKLYDGTPISYLNITSTYTVPSTGLIRKETTNNFRIEGTEFDVEILKTTTFNAIGSERNVIDFVEGFKVMNGANDVTNCFKFVEEEDGIGMLTIKSRGVIEVQTQGGEWVYDGQEHTKQAAADVNILSDLYGTDQLIKTWNEDSKIKNVGEVLNKLDIRVMDGGVDVTDGYIITETFGKLKVTPVVISFDSGSYSFGYDGNEHSYFDITVDGKYFTEPGATIKGLGEDIIVINATLSASDIGYYPNIVVGYSINGVEVEDAQKANYIFEGNNVGTISIGSCGDLTITTEDGEWTYDGQKHENHKYTLEGEIQEGHTFEIIWSEDASLTDAYITSNRCEIVITDGEGKPVTNGYNVYYNYGTLRVNPKEITYSTESISEMYSGLGTSNHKVTITYLDAEGVEQIIKTSQQNEEFVILGNTFKVSTTICDSLGTFDNTAEFTIKQGDLDKSGNFIIKQGTIGKLTVLKRGDIEISTSSGTWVYDTKAHMTGDGTAKPIKSGSGYESSSIRYTNTLYGSDLITATLRHTNLVDVCNYTNAADYRILDSTGKIDLTKGYNITEKFGTVQIKPFIVGYTSESRTVTFNRKPLTCFDLTLVNYEDGNGTVYSLGDLEGLKITDSTPFKVYVSTSDKTGYDISVLSTASITDPGSVANLITNFTINGEVATSGGNIDIRPMNAGQLTVSDATIVTVQITGIKVKYDGKPHGVTNLTTYQVFKPESVGSCEFDLEGLITEAGSLTLGQFTDMNISNCKFYDRSGQDITKDVAVKFVVDWDGQVTDSLDADLVVVKTRSITVKTGTMEKDWDGTALTCETLKVIVGSLGDGDELVFDGAFTGTITDIGSTENTIDATKIHIMHNGTQDVTESYKIKVNYGTLTINDPNTL